jgi:uncharacterized Zn finger protein
MTLAKILSRTDKYFDLLQVMMKCACCGEDMLLYKELEKITIYRCKECGLSNNRLKSGSDNNKNNS